MFYHVLNRGNERHVIFRDDRDCEAFLSRLGRCSQRFGLGIYAYVLMSNHYHLVVKTGRPNLSAALHWLQTSYTSWHNARHERHGHLFQGRFRSLLVQGDSHLQRLLLYVHRNPLRAGLVPRLRDYPWSSYTALAYDRRTPAWFDPALVYEQLGIDAATLRKVIAAYDEQKDSLWSDLHSGLVLGSHDLVAKLRRQLGVSRDTEKAPPNQLHPAPDLSTRIADYARRLQIARPDYEELFHPVRHRPRPLRDVLICLLWREGRYGLADIARVFHVSPAAVSQARRRGEDYLQAHPRDARAWGSVTAP